ncbi:MAG: DUF3488 and transglutaminase-like domain-containing protein [Arthrobacter sp.]|nr:DUF3488 and transglutaminase-like domain-containing protein [Arthrobacter sp.]
MSRRQPAASPWAPDAAPGTRTATRTATPRVAGAVAEAWLGALITTGAVVLGVLPVLGLLVEGGTWVAPAVLTTALVAAAGALSRQLLRRSWPAWPVQALIALGAWTLTALSGSDRIGPFPAPGSGSAIRASLTGIGSVLRDEVAPVRPVPEVVGVLLLSVAVLALAVDALVNAAPRTPALAALPVGAVALSVSLFVERTLGGWIMAGLAAALLGLLLAPRGGEARPSRAAGRRPARPDDPATTRPKPAAHPHPRAGLARRLVAAGAVSAVAIGGAALAPAVLLPDPQVGILPVGSRLIAPGAGSGVDPILDLSRDLRSPLNRTVLRYTSTRDQAVYLRTSIVEDLVDGGWGPATDDRRGYQESTPLSPDPTSSGSALTTGPLPAQAPSEEAMAGTGYSREWLRSGTSDDYLNEGGWPPLTQEERRSEDLRVGVDATGYSSPWLPLPAGATRAGELPSTYTVIGTSGVLKQADDASIAGGSYWAAAATPPSAEDLAASPSLATIAEQAEEYGVAPEGDPQGSDEDRERIPESIRDLAARIVSEAGAGGHPSAIANALREHLTSDEYQYSERAPVSLDGKTGGLAMVERFLKDKSGYCVHFASAMVLMARSQGIPARLALGYAPAGTGGAASRIAGVEGKVFDVNSRSAHAWAQLYFVGIGWVDVDPTPGRGGTDSDAALQNATAAPGATAAPSSSATTAPETVASDPRPSAGRTNAVDGATVAATNPTAGAERAAGDAGGATWPLWLGLGVLAAAGLGLLMPSWARKRRMERIRAGGPGSAALAWRTMSRAAARATGAQENLPAPAQAAAWFPEGEAAAAAARLAAAADRERFGPPPVPAAAAGASDALPDGAAQRGEALGADLAVVLAALKERRGKRWHG